MALASGDVAKPTDPIPEVLASGTILKNDTTVEMGFRQGDPSGSIQCPEPMGLSTQVAADCATAFPVKNRMKENINKWINFFILKNINTYFIQIGRKYNLKFHFLLCALRHLLFI